jgi:hypothetical protein
VYDIIGDIHGYSKTLEALLCKLGYSNQHGFYSHEGRKVIFVGDFIDRGPAIRDCLQIVKSMHDHGTALAVMGNHEYNAICFNTPNLSGDGWLREHSPKNIKQHSATIEAFKDYEAEWKGYLEWFMDLPLFLDFGNLRVVHAFWGNHIVETVLETLPGNTLNKYFLHKSAQKGLPEHDWIEKLLKGIEIQLPENYLYTDKDGIERSEIRIKWWKQLNAETYQSLSVKPDMRLPEGLVSSDVLKTIPVYPKSDPAVFVGHYWATGEPQVLSHNVCCVDYSVAKAGKLVAYRWNGENTLSEKNLVSQQAID